ncbi:MAG: kynureninase [Bacteroidetes bacterium]|nr:MAG: kynureninase [Bacteroidota bacterium]
MTPYTKEYAIRQDEKDPLKHFKSRFIKSDSDLIYLDGNSLGMLPCETPHHMDRVVKEEWGKGLIRSWNTGWYERSAQLAAKLAPLIGAQPEEVMIADSTSVNLFKLAYAALQHQQGRKGIVSDQLNFPSDIYVLQGLVELLGNKHQLRLASSADEMTVSMEELEKQLSDDSALLTLSHVVFKSAFMYDMKAVTRLAHKKGAMVLWDLSHAVGSVPVYLNDSNADLAIGCTYKYLNGGPGAPAFLYVRKDLQQKLQSPVQGWFGQSNPFEFNLDYQPAVGINRFLAGTPPLLSLSALEPALEIMTEAGINNLRNKSVLQTRYLISLVEEYLSPLGFSLASPGDETRRGSHISIRHAEAYRICKALIDPQTGDRVIIPDFREPDNIRLGIAPLYNSFLDIYEAVMQLKLLVEEELYSRFPLTRETVT